MHIGLTKAISWQSEQPYFGDYARRANVISCILTVSQRPVLLSMLILHAIAAAMEIARFFPLSHTARCSSGSTIENGTQRKARATSTSATIAQNMRM